MLMEKVANPKTLVYKGLPMVIKTEFIFDEQLQKDLDQQSAKVIDAMIDKKT
jgi:hypothetical protein